MIITVEDELHYDNPPHSQPTPTSIMVLGCQRDPNQRKARWKAATVLLPRSGLEKRKTICYIQK